jgi:hypothetical protein
MAFGLQNVTIAATPTGRIDSEYLSGADGSQLMPAWATTGYPSLSLQINDPALSLDLADPNQLLLADPGSPAAELGFYPVSGTSPQEAGFTISGTVLSNPLLLASAGSFRLVAVRGLRSVLSPILTFAIAPDVNATVDNIPPTRPTGITAVPGTNVGDILVTFDPPSDIAPPGVSASGAAHVDVLVNNAVAPSPSSPVTTVKNALGSPLSVNVGNITNPEIPAFDQNGTAFSMTAAGTGIVGTTAEQCLLVDFGLFSGARKFVARVQAYQSVSGGSSYSVAYSEPASASDALVGQSPSRYTVVIGESVTATDSYA